jgi:hypothetical protein
MTRTIDAPPACPCSLRLAPPAAPGLSFGMTALAARSPRRVGDRPPHDHRDAAWVKPPACAVRLIYSVTLSRPRPARGAPARVVRGRNRRRRVPRRREMVVIYGAAFLRRQTIGYFNVSTPRRLWGTRGMAASIVIVWSATILVWPYSLGVPRGISILARSFRHPLGADHRGHRNGPSRFGDQPDGGPAGELPGWHCRRPYCGTA